MADDQPLSPGATGDIVVEQFPRRRRLEPLATEHGRHVVVDPRERIERGDIAVPASQGERLARELLRLGAEWEIAFYGLEALAVMRIEKGHVSGPELNGQTTAADLGFGRLASSKKDYVGAVMARRPALIDPQRPGLVGFRPVDRAKLIRAGAHLLEKGAAAATESDIGYLTSATVSPTLGHSIALGFIEGGAKRLGDVVRAWDGLRDSDVEVEVCPPVFLDPEGVRLRG